MILIPILLVIFTWLFILWLCNQHRYLNVFEQLALWFVTALSLFVFELFIWGMIFNKLSLLWPIITFSVCLALLIYRNNKHKWFMKEIIQYIKSDFYNIKTQFKLLKNWKQYIIIGVLIYVLLKLFMVFSINTHMPTFDEDAVAWIDMKTKIFTENKSLVLNKWSIEYLWNDFSRYPFSAIVDTYFLLPYWYFIDWLSNIISPLIYIMSLLVLFWIFLRKSNLLWASISSYIFSSLPFIFIHWIWSYLNFLSGVLLFIFTFYCFNQLFELRNNTRMWIIICIVGFLTTTIRNESFLLTVAIIAILGIYMLVKKGRNQLYTQKRIFLGPVVWILLWYGLIKIVTQLYPKWIEINTSSWGLFSIDSLIENIKKPWVFLAPFNQVILHPDYSLLFYLFIISIIILILNYKKTKDVDIFMLITWFLLCMFMVILYITPWLWLVTHFAFIRYPSAIVLFIVYVVIYTFYDILHNYHTVK